MTTAVIGVGNVGSAVARNLVRGGEPVDLDQACAVLAAAGVAV